MGQAAKPFDVGVVVVHGIGDQDRHHTLSTYGGAILDFIGDRAEVAGVPFAVQTDTDALHFQWTPRARPHCAEVSEAWWADEFDRPSVSRVIAWTAVVAPWMLHRLALSRQMFPTGDGVFMTLFAVSASIVGRLLSPFRRLGLLALGVTVLGLVWGIAESGPAVLIAIGTVALVLLALGVLSLYLAAGYLWLSTLVRLVAFSLLAVLAQTALLMLALLALLPIPGVRRFALRVTNALTLSVGDSYAFVNDAEAESRIVSAVEHAITAQASRCHAIVVVAHSQGCAVVERVLQQQAPANLHSVVALGSGLAKLSHLRQGGRSVARLVAGSAARVGIALATGSLILISWIRGWRFDSGPSRWDRLTQSDATTVDTSEPAIFLILIASGSVLAAWGAWGYYRAWRVTNDTYDRHRANSGGWTWVDVHASHDLVPDGLTDIDPDFGDSVTVINRASYALDHVTYHENPVALSLITREIEHASGSQPTLAHNDHDLGVVQTERRHRGALKAPSITLACVLVAVPFASVLSAITGLSGIWCLVLSAPIVLSTAARPWRRWHDAATDAERRTETVPVGSGVGMLSPWHWLRLPRAPLADIYPNASFAEDQHRRRQPFDQRRQARENARPLRERLRLSRRNGG